MKVVTYLVAAVLSLAGGIARADEPSNEGNRLTVVDDGANLYYPNHLYPRLTTAQWAGEDIDLALVFAIDDMRNPAQYEAYLRPILERLKKIDGRAPASIMANWCDPNDPQLQKWLGEGVSIETHTADHPCPILAKGDFAAARSTYDRCVDHMFTVPNNKPVGFRTPCMDGINSASPRLFAEILMKTTTNGNFLANSSSVGVLLTKNDPELPKDLVLDANGTNRFGKYILKGFINYVENYPYPYVVGNKFWEMPFCMPDDYEGFAVQGEKSPKTVADMKAAIDAVAIKKGLWVMTFHPYPWIGNHQVVELVDHVDAKYGKRARFFNLREVQERIDKNLLGGQPLRSKNGDDNGVRLLDLNNDGYLDVVIGNDQLQQTRIWDEGSKQWKTSSFPGKIVTIKEGKTILAGTRFGVMGGKGNAVVLLANEAGRSFWKFDGAKWVEAKEYLNGLELNGQKWLAAQNGQDTGLRFRDVDGDKVCELLISNPKQNVVLAWDAAAKSWKPMEFQLPPGVALVSDAGMDAGLRFVDLNKDGYDDIVFSNKEKFGVWLYVPEIFLGFKKGWSREIIVGKRGEKPEIPMIVRGGDHPDNGAWFAMDHLWVQNEDTATLPDLVDRLSFADILNGLQPKPLAPREALNSLQTAPDHMVELVAHEPVVQDPVAMDWSADGRLWVVEMRDYPTSDNGRVSGVVKTLHDEDGDGFYEKSTVFLDGLSTPNGIMPWRNGVLISATPNIIYAEDTNGDGKADKQEVLFSGFGEGNQQHRANGFELGLDNWIYVANGDSGGTILSHKTGKRLPINGRDFRFHPDSGEFSTTSGQTQFGRRRDDWGNWFGGANYSWGWHYFLPEHYLSRNSRLGVPTTYRPIAQYPNGGAVFPIARLQQRFNDVGMRGHVTSACGFIPYRDNLFGPEFSSSFLISEPSHNLVHRELLKQEGVSFNSSRADSEQNREFLASTDIWFRPTGIKTGPDGAIYVADMYRLVIEHPEWIPEDVRKRVNVRAGDDMGRIYRVRPKNVDLRKTPRLYDKSGATLAAAMESSNGWQRDTVHRLILERQDKSATETLINISKGSSILQSRVQALCALDGIGGVTQTLLAELLQDKEAIIREHAIRISEQFLHSGTTLDGNFQKALLAKVNDPELRVRFQLAFSLGEWKSPEAANALAQLAINNANSDAVQTAVLSSSSAYPEKILLESSALKGDGGVPGKVSENLIQLLVQNKKSDDIDALLTKLLSTGSNQKLPAWKLRTIASLLDAQEKLSGESPVLENANWEGVVAQARELIQNSSSSNTDKISALRLLGRNPAKTESDFAAMTSLLAPQTNTDLQKAALGEMGRIRNIDLARGLLPKWQTSTPQTRGLIINLLMRREQWIASLLEAVNDGTISKMDLGPTVRQQLLSHASKDIRTKAEKTFNTADSESTEKNDLVKGLIAKVGNLKGNPEHGQTLFENNCATCHKAGQIGFGAGPNLAMIYENSLEQILTAIVDPNRAVEDKYRNYIADLKDGEQLTGILLSETGGSITIMGISGQGQTVLRQDLQKLTAENRSMMPEGFEQFLKPQDFSDLVAFIRTSAATPKVFAGNKPSVVFEEKNGEVRLKASKAEVYGDTLAFESQYKNLGMWGSANDKAVWSVELESDQEYQVWLDFACHQNTHGNSFILQIGDTRLVQKVPSTGTWDDYQQKKFGVIKVPAGKHRVLFQAEENLKGHLIDLREIRLVPKGASTSFGQQATADIHRN